MFVICLNCKMAKEKTATEGMIISLDSRLRVTNQITGP